MGDSVPPPLGCRSMTRSCPVHGSETCGDTLLPGMASSILGCDATDAEALVAVVAHGAGADWRAAAFLLQHHPQHRELYGDLGHDRRIHREYLARVIAAVADAALHPDDERRVLLQMQAHGVGTAE